jgi:hypothetical protein
MKVETRGMGAVWQYRRFSESPGICRRALLAAVLLLSAVGAAGAEEYDVIPSLTVKEEYSDNVRFSSTDRQSSFITGLSPRLELKKRDERLDASLLAGLDVLFYQEQRTRTTACNQRYSGRLSYRVTERFRASMDAGYSVINQPDRDLEQNGVVIDALRRDLRSGSGSFDYTLSDTSMFWLTYRYQEELYRDASSSDTLTHSATFGYEHDLQRFLPKTKGRFQFGYSSYALDYSHVDNYSAMVGFVWDINELWHVSADGGGRYTRNEVRLSGSRESDSGLGWVAGATLSVRGEVDSGSLSFSRNVGFASSRSGTSENTTLDCAYRRSLTPELAASVSFGYQRSESTGSAFSADTIDEDYLRFSTGLRYEFSKTMALEASYAYLKALYNQSGTSADRSTAVVSFTVRHPLLDRW